jgi:hypothetical protein
MELELNERARLSLQRFWEEFQSGALATNVDDMDLHHPLRGGKMGIGMDTGCEEHGREED